MFGSEVFQMLGNYDQRKVGRFKAEWGFISTCEVTDGAQPYETAVCHNAYRTNGDMVIVEAYDTRAEAAAGHDKWVKKMTAKRLPRSLTDCANSEISALGKTAGCKMVFKRKAAK